MIMMRLLQVLPILLPLAQGKPQPLNGTISRASTYTVPTSIPTSDWASFYVLPGPSQEPNPVVSDAVLHTTFPFNLTNPNLVPTTNADPTFLPQPTGTPVNGAAAAQSAIAQIKSIIAGDTGLRSNCSKCIAGLAVGKKLAQDAPQAVPAAILSLCQTTGFMSNSSCAVSFSPQDSANYWTQVLAFADVEGLDGQYICSVSLSFCPLPHTSALNTTGLFPKPKPTRPKTWKQSGKRAKVVHMSDIHIDARYKVGSEGNCTSGQCCEANSKNSALSASDKVSVPAPLYGWYQCDPPYDQLIGLLEAVGPLTGTSTEHPLDMGIYTGTLRQAVPCIYRLTSIGDMLTHDPANELSQVYVEYAETIVVDLLKNYLNTPVMVALGNHDTSPVAYDVPHSLPGNLSTEFSWNYNHVAGLWQNAGWITAKDAQEARTHYGGYSVKTHLGVRVISFNTDFWYRANIFNFINTTNPDVSGTFKFMIKELQAAEDAGEAVWIIGHVPSGWTGTAPLPDPSNLFYQIVDRYAPHVIRHIYFGHNHEDEMSIFYSKNGTIMDASHALTAAWLGPSVTPGTNVNSAFKYYEIDTGSFDVLDSYTYYSNVSQYPNLNGTGPVWQFEYSTRDAYPVPGWSKTDPLNGTYWHLVTEQMEKNLSLATKFNNFQGRLSKLSPNCNTTQCQEAKICYIRSGSVALAQKCVPGFGSVQSPFTPNSTKNG